MKAIVTDYNDKPFYKALPKTGIVCSRFFLMMLGCMFLIQAKSQTDKRLLLADKYFAAGDYFTAAGLYQQFLNPVATRKLPGGFPLNSKRNAEGKTGKMGSKTEIVFKQAESYRLAHYWTEASALYKECFSKDSIKYGPALYWYGVCQRSLGNYLVAEESIDRFLSNYTTSQFLEAAKNEKQTLTFIKQQRSKPDTVLYNVKSITNSFGNDKGLFAPASFSANSFIITSTQTDSVVAGTNPYHNRLFQAVLTSNSFQTPEPVVIENLDLLLNQGTASISPNGNFLYYTQWKRSNGKTLSSIYLSAKKGNGWSEPKLLSSVNEEGFSSKQPFCTADGKYLFFASDRTGGKGNFDIWYAPLQSDGTAGNAVNVVGINSENNEQAPFYHNAGGSLVFSSDRTPGMGGLDLFSSKGSEAQWTTPINLGYPVNSSRDDAYFFSSQSGDLLSNAIISSDRGSECCLATYAVSKTVKKKMITGVINDCRDNAPLSGAEVSLKDVSGKTMKTVTGADGKYIFEIGSDIKQGQIFVTKERYMDKIGEISVESVNETAWHTDTLVSNAVCIEKKLVIKVENVVSVYFDFDKSELKERGINQLDSIYNVLLKDTSATLQISGYTDGKGSAEYNKKLSDKRAKICADYLIQIGVDPSRISFESFGACCPVEMELINGRDNPDGRSMNRRALINITKD